MLFIMIQLMMTMAYAKCQDPNEKLLMTADNAAVCLHHYPAEGPAVLLVHGISSNAAFWDMSDELSVAQYLQDSGFDVWALDERGHGEAKRTLDNKRQRHGWLIDDYGQFDIDTAIQHIQKTGHTSIHYIGHSLGGMALAPYIQSHGTEALRSITVIASPMDFSHPDLLWRAANPIAPFTPPRIPTDTLARMGAVFPSTPFAIDDFLYTEGTITPAQRRLMYRRVVSPLTRQEVLQVHRTMKSGTFQSQDGIEYMSVLNQVSVRALVVAGRGDHVAPSDRVYGYFQALGSPYKKWLVMGTDFGHQHDYGHLDIILSNAAFEDLIPQLVDWLKEPDTPNVFPDDLSPVQ